MLRKIGINVVSVLTPETAKRLGACDGVSRVQTVLMRNYIAEFTKTLSLRGIVVVAQQATGVVMFLLILRNQNMGQASSPQYACC